MSSPTRPGVWLPEIVLMTRGGCAHRLMASHPGVQRRGAFMTPAAGLKPDAWCHTCFYGRRCTVCGRPSGDLDQCGPCLHAATTLDKAIEARTQ